MQQVLVVYYSNHFSITFVTFQGNSTVTFYGNFALNNGGVIYLDGYYNSSINFQENSTITFYGNKL